MKQMSGADSTELEALAQQVTREADAIDEEARLLGANFRSIAWLGAVVEDFETFWNSTLVASVGGATTFLREAATGLQRQAEEQRSASQAVSGGGHGIHAGEGDSSGRDGADGMIGDHRRVNGSFIPDDPLYRRYRSPTERTVDSPWWLSDGKPISTGSDDDSVTPNDLKQGGIRDCYVITALSVIASQNPNLIRDAIVDNGDGTYTVRFFNSDQEAEYVTVDAEIPLIEAQTENGEWVKARGPAGPGDGERWPRILEKAYGKWKSGEDDLAGIYDWLDHGGHATSVYSALSGHPSTSHDPGTLSMEELQEIHDDGGALSLSSIDYVKGDGITTYKVGDDTLHMGHAYWIENVDAKSGTITIRNPNSYENTKIVLTYDEFTEAFDRVHSNPL